MTSELSQSGSARLGLVLEGGGAKGAYAFGCLLAFAEAGVQFDVITGTSVGALNAVLYATRQLEFGKAYWGGIRHGNVYRPQLKVTLFFPLLFLRALFYAASRATGARWPRLSAAGKYLFFSVFCTALLALPLWGLSALVGWERGQEWSLWYLGQLRFHVYTLGFLLLLSIPYLLDKAGIALLFPSPLRREVERIAARMDATKASVYVTVTELQSLIDPDRVWDVNGRPFPVVERLPVYIKVNELDPTERINAVMASAALPVGIFPPVVVGGRRYTDGGEVDNVPVYPLMSIDPCETLVVVRLRPVVGEFPDDTVDSYLEHWSACDRSIRLKDLGESRAREIGMQAYVDIGGYAVAMKYSPPRLFPRRKPEFRPQKIITIAPKKQLGGFLTGTLNFRARTARLWMEQGYRDAQAATTELGAPAVR